MMSLIKLVFQSTLPVRGATAAEGLSTGISEFQSTLPVRGATLVIQLVYTTLRISIHAPRAGSDTTEIDIAVRAMLFQSTPPVRGATFHLRAEQCYHHHFNPRPPCGGRHNDAVITIVNSDFNPRPPCGGRPRHIRANTASDRISIHAPRAGGDRTRILSPAPITDFNPRPPCGGRHCRRVIDSRWAM